MAYLFGYIAALGVVVTAGSIHEHAKDLPVEPVDDSEPTTMEWIMTAVVFALIGLGIGFLIVFAQQVNADAARLIL